MRWHDHVRRAAVSCVRCVLSLTCDEGNELHGDVDSVDVWLGQEILEIGLTNDPLIFARRWKGSQERLCCALVSGTRT